MRKRSFSISLSAIILAIFVAIAATFYFLCSPIITEKNGIIYDLRPGTSKKTLITELSQQHIISHPFLFSMYIYTRKNGQLKTGEYLFPKGATPYSIWQQLTTGTGLYYRPFTIIPGKTFADIRRDLAAAPGLKQLTKKWDDQKLMMSLGYDNIKPEGQFFPETYYYTKGNLDLVILKRAADLMKNHLNEAWRERAANLPYKTAYEALIVASLIEKEAYLNTERPIIAGVIVNRLNKNMLLQIDPTVIYGMGDRYQGKIFKQDLREDTAYNTYVHKGLPPTPIATPSMSSIDAALKPQQHNFYYFVAKGDGSHQFSATLPEHNAAVTASINAKKVS